MDESRNNRIIANCETGLSEKTCLLCVCCLLSVVVSRGSEAADPRAAATAGTRAERADAGRPSTDSRHRVAHPRAARRGG